MMQNKIHFFKLTLPTLCHLAQEAGFSPAQAKTFFRFVYQQHECHPQSPFLSASFMKWISEHFTFSLPVIKKTIQAQDQTVKFLLELQDQQTIEMVLIPFQAKWSLCLSSQVGCALACRFCATGLMGLKRSLTTEEIIAQWWIARDWLIQQKKFSITSPLPLNDFPKLTNLVFMGQGEPLQNTHAIGEALHIFQDKNGCHLSRKKITISTAGWLPGLEWWLSEKVDVNLAFSLHSALPVKRSNLVPLEKKFPLSQVTSFLQKIPLEKKRFITLEVTLLKGHNDGEEDCDALIEYCRDLQKHNSLMVNLIPYNPFPESHYTPAPQQVLDAFYFKLQKARIPVTRRRTKGQDVQAACGQLNTASKKRKPLWPIQMATEQTL
jgi:23S rRNA (adenine2503-C2)-methyltransferase